MLPRSFKAVKCKTALKLAVARIKLLKNKREVQVRQMRRDLAQLLESGQEQTARIRVEHVIREEKTMSAYDLIELYCELIVARLPIIESQKGCPIDLKEAVSSVLFASPRCADIPELMDVRKQFVAKYGKEFVNSALEVRPDCGVNRMVVEKLSAKAPDVETKIKTLTAIAQEHSVKWDPKALEEELHKPNSDLLNGPNTFANASKMSMESYDAKLSSAPNQMNESTMKPFQNDITSKHASMNTFSHSNIGTNSTPASSSSHNRPRGKDNRFGEEATPYSRTDSSSLDQQSWNMEFKDAASAAQAAAESAERASMAARAAAELASRGNVSRPPSAGSRESSKHDIRDDKPNKSKGPKIEATQNAQNLLSDEEMLKRFQELKRGVQTLPSDDTQVGSRREAENMNDGNVKLGSVNRSPSHSSECSIDDDELETELRKTDKRLYGHAQESFSKAEPIEQEVEHKKNSDVGLDQWNINESYDNSASHWFNRSATDDDSNVHSNIQKNGSNSGKDYETDSEGEPVESSQKQPTYGDYSSAVFDDYGSATDNISFSGRHRGGNSYDPFQPTQEESSIFSSKADPLSRKQHSSRSLYEGSSSQQHFVTETSPIEHFKTINDSVSLSRSDKNLTATFDDSDGLSSESDGEVVKPVHKEAIELDSSLHNNRSFTRETISEGSNHGLHNYSFKGGKEDGEANRLSTVSPSSYEEKHELEAWKQPDSIDLLDNPTSSNSRRGSYKYPTDNKSLHVQSSQASEKADADDMNQQQSPPSDTSDTEASLYGIDTVSGQGLGLGRLTGGFKNKGFQRPPYVKNPLAKSSLPSQQTSNDRTQVPTVSHLSKSTGGSKFPDHVGYDKDVQNYLPDSRISPSYMESGFDKAEELMPTNTFGRRDYRGAALLSSDETTGGTPTRRERTIVTHHDEISEDPEVPALGSYNKTLGKDYELSSESAESNISPEGDVYFPRTVASRRSKGKASVKPKQNSSTSLLDSKQTLSSSQGPKVESVSQRQQMKTYNEPSLRKPVVYFESDEDDPEELNNSNMVGTKSSIAVKLSRRTRDSPSDAKRENNLRFISRSDVPADFQKDCKTSRARSREEENSNSLQTNSVTEESSVVPTISQSSVYRDSSKTSNQNLTQSTNNENPATSSSDVGTAPGDSSLKKASHVHPKLPDYDSFAAHFHSLRSNIH